MTLPFNSLDDTFDKHRYEEKYPRKPISCRVNASEGLEGNEVEALQKELHEMSLKFCDQCEVCAFNLIEAAKDFITVKSINHQPEPSISADRPQASLWHQWQARVQEEAARQKEEPGSLLTEPQDKQGSPCPSFFSPGVDDYAFEGGLFADDDDEAEDEDSSMVQIQTPPTANSNSNTKVKARIVDEGMLEGEGDEGGSEEGSSDSVETPKE